MLRIAVIVAALAVFPTVSFAARRGDAPVTGSPVAKVVTCDVLSSERSATFFARMDTIPGASKLAIRFQLLQRLGRDSGFDKVNVPALNQWHTSQAGVKRYGWKQTVDNLLQGGAYKARVQYRWLSATGTVVATDSRDTPTCHGPLPNIAIGDLTVKPGPSSDTRTYRVGIQNTGKIEADEVDVQMAVDKAILDTLTLDHLAPGEQRFATFTGPVCHHGVRVKADPGNTIGETIEDDNSELFACP
jgi:CARDB